MAGRRRRFPPEPCPEDFCPEDFCPEDFCADDFWPDPFDRRGLSREGSSAPATVQFPPGGGTYTLQRPPGNTTAYYGFKLMPLVFSAGPDGELGIYGIQDSEYDRGPSVAWNPYSWHYGNPRGMPVLGLEGGGHADNITNHRLGTR